MLKPDLLGAGSPAAYPLACCPQGGRETAQSGREARHGGPTGPLRPGKIEPLLGRAAAEKVLRSFNTWAFKREQPSDPELMLQFISQSIASNVPVRFVLYWGKGPRTKIEQP